MVRIILITLLVLFWSISAKSQELEIGDYNKLPLVVTIQFHSLALPFSDLGLSNFGIGLGTEVNWNKDHTLVQKFGISWLGNQSVGNRLILSSQFSWRPRLIDNFFTELKFGAGYLRANRPTDSFKLINGAWEPIGRKGKGMLAIPIGVSLGYENFSENHLFAPFVSYDFLLASGYSRSIPLVPETLLQIGSRIHFK